MIYELTIKGWLEGTLVWRFESLNKLQEFVELSMKCGGGEKYEYSIKIIKSQEEGD